MGETPDNSTYTSGAVAATWFINEQTAGGSNAEISLQWSQMQETAGFDRTQSYLGHYTSGSWSLGIVGTATGSNPFSFNRTGITSFSPFGILNSGATLPLHFLSFSAQKCNTNDVCITWKTANEQNVSHFEIERSYDGINFIKIGNRAAFNQDTNLYTYTDNAITATKHYYRIKQVDKDGSSSYSKIVLITNNNKNDYTIYPTVFTNSFNIQNNNNGNASLQLYRPDGKMIKQQIVQVGTNIIEVKNSATGILFYKIIKNNQVVQSGKLTKLK